MPLIHNTGATCSINHLNENAYALNIEFENGHKEFVFERKKQPQKNAVYDVFTKNGVCPSKTNELIKNLFRKDEHKEASLAHQQLQNDKADGCVVAVFDLQSKPKRYAPNDEVAKCEVIVQDFFMQGPTKTNGYPKQLHTLFKDNLKVDYLLCEGSLKMALLTTGFEDTEITYLNSKEGAMDFCGITEYFMTAFKMGFEVKTPNKSILVGESYFKGISTQESYKPTLASTVYYPKSYEDMYALDGRYAQIMQNAFTVTGGFNTSTNISTITLEKS